MKTFRLIGMALIAVVMSVNFIACSSDDDEEPIKNDDGVITNEKKLVEIKEAYEDGTNVMTFSYDSKGKLTSIITKDFDSSNSDITNITWGENTIRENSNGESITYFLNDGLIRTGSDSDGGDYSLAYNSSKQLTTYQYEDKYDSDTSTYTWENGKLVKYIYSDDYYSEETQIKYNGQTCKGFFPLWGWVVEDDCYTFIAHPELVGFRNNYLPSQFIEIDGDDISNMSYTFDEDGYVESCTVTTTDGYYNDTTIYTFKWQ